MDIGGEESLPDSPSAQSWAGAISLAGSSTDRSPGAVVRTSSGYAVIGRGLQLVGSRTHHC
eukprot:3030750-Pyramimonas_sp.AAC.1